MSEINPKDLEQFLDNEWDNLDVVEKAEYLKGGTAEAEADYKLSPYYEGEE
jgi:hypothetical protein